jgi:hypothetical protein
MEFHLLYSGKLTKNASVTQKHSIRQQINPQLLNLWITHPALRWMREHGICTKDSEIITLDQFATQFRVGDFRFVPLICETFLTTCSLDILFLRREDPGAIIGQSGDIDNRIKTLFDALRMPKPGEEMKNLKPSEEGEDPFFCLLENDSRITDFRVTGDRLLTPIKEPSHSENEVHLVIRVKVNVVRPIPLNMSFL